MTQTQSKIQSAYALAKERYAALGVDTEQALATLEKVAISLHCWQGDDVGGFENPGGALTGGIAATGNYPGKARTADELRKDLVAQVRNEIGAIASPDVIQWAPGLPKTRSGKIMRRILRKIAEDEFSNLGDISTLADPAVVQDLIDNRQNRKAG